MAIDFFIENRTYIIPENFQELSRFTVKSSPRPYEVEIKNDNNIQQEINYNLQQLRLKELRKEQKLTQKELAKAINVAPSTIGDYEKRNKPIATPFLYDICKKYNISADYLLGKIDNPKYLK